MADSDTALPASIKTVAIFSILRRVISASFCENADRFSSSFFSRRVGV